MGKQQTFYAVGVGRNVGVYQTWEECQKQVDGYSNSRFKSFKNQDDAIAFVNQYNQDQNQAQRQVEADDNDSKEDKKKRPRQNQEQERQHQVDVDEEKPSGSGLGTAKRQRSAATETTTESSLQQQQQQTVSLWFQLNFDGGSRGNPGIAGAGAEIVTRILLDAKQDHNHESQGSCKKNQTRTHNNNDKNNGKNTITARRMKTKIRTYLGNHSTNNQAEYAGLIVGLQHILDSLVKENCWMKVPPSSSSSSSGVSSADDDDDATTAQTFPSVSKVTVIAQGDSQLIIKQLKGENKCRNAKLQPLHTRCLELIESIKQQSQNIINKYSSTNNYVIGRTPTMTNPVSVDLILEHVCRDMNSNADGMFSFLFIMSLYSVLSGHPPHLPLFVFVVPSSNSALTICVLILSSIGERSYECPKQLENNR